MAEFSCDHVHVRSLDADTMAAFFTGPFGATTLFRRTVDGNLRIGLMIGGLSVFIDQVPAGTPTTPASPFVGIDHICLGVKGIDAAAEELRRSGVKFLVEPQELRPGIRYAFVEGPDKLRMELIDRAA